MGKAKPRALNDEEYNHLHTYILNNCDEIEAYQSIYKDQVMEKYPDMTEDRFEALKEKQFSKWLQFYVNSCVAYGTHVPEWLKDIVFGPFKIVNLYPRYCTRGYAFRIAKRDVNRTTVDSGVSSSSGDMTYYGVLKEIMEVMYPGGIGLKCIVFNCDWYDSVNGVKVDEFGVTSVHSRKHLTKFDPFILASQADQVCYLRYPMKGDRSTPWLVVTSINPRGIIIENPDGNPLQQTREGYFSVHDEPHVDLTIEGEDFVLQVTDDEGEEFEDDEDSIPSSSEEDSG